MKRICSWTLAIVFACATPVVKGQCCDDDQCDRLASACCQDDGCRMYLGVEATYLAPLYSTKGASFTFEDQLTPASVTIGSTFDSAEELTGAPRITLGYVGRRGIGVQLRYWELNNAYSENALALPVVGNQVQALGGDDQFDAYAIDLELTKGCCHRGWEMVGTFGARNASTSHNRINNVVGAVNGDVFSLSSFQREAFSGTGLTFSLSGLKTINPCRCLSIYTNVRGSTIFGSAKTSAITQSSFVGPFAVGTSTNGALSDSDETMFIGELGAGLQWSRLARSFNGRMFARVGAEYQYWGASNGNAIAGSFSGSPGFSNATVVASGRSQEVNLIGFTLAAGFAW